MQIFERRENMKQGGVPTVGDAWFVIAITANPEFVIMTLPSGAGVIS